MPGEFGVSRVGRRELLGGVFGALKYLQRRLPVLLELIDVPELRQKLRILRRQGHARCNWTLASGTRPRSREHSP